MFGIVLAFVRTGCSDHALYMIFINVPRDHADSLMAIAYTPTPD